eukprot:7486569-Pyramimonas_sp.AAC.1
MEGRSFSKWGSRLGAADIRHTIWGSRLGAGRTRISQEFKGYEGAVAHWAQVRAMRRISYKGARPGVKGNTCMDS